MFCRNCGKEIDDNVVICPVCGVQQQALSVEIQKPPSNSFGIAGFVLSIISIWLGLLIIPETIGIVLSVLGFRRKAEYGNKVVTVAGLVINIIILSFYVLLIILMLTVIPASA